jgi:dTDP-4-amino-4,6-dideoxygalactose transaminase
MTARRDIAIAAPCTGEEEWQALREPLMTGWLTQGPKVAEFERRFAERHSTDFAIAVTSATTGLQLALAALKIGPGDEVIVPAFTWIATANVVVHAGATPVLVDVDPITFNIDPEAVAGRLNSATRAIIAVHLFGLCADIDAIAAVAPGIPIIEDAACAAGSGYKGRSAGSLGAFGVFSFHPRKSITCGEGGMVTTANADLAELAVQLRNHGASPSDEQRHEGPKPHLLPEFAIAGFNFRMTDLQAAVGLVQLSKLDRFIDERNHGALLYARELANVDWLQTPSAPTDRRHGWQAYVCRVDPERAPAPRNEIMRRLAERGVSTRPGTHAIHMLSFYRQRFGFVPESFPNARDSSDQTMAIPLHNRMDPDDFAYVVEAIRSLR